MSRRHAGMRRRLGLEVYVHRLRADIAAMTASLGGIDVLAFTGGIGERSAEIRRRAVAGLGFLAWEWTSAATVTGAAATVTSRRVM